MAAEIGGIFAGILGAGALTGDGGINLTGLGGGIFCGSLAHAPKIMGVTNDTAKSLKLCQVKKDFANAGIYDKASLMAITR